MKKTNNKSDGKKKVASFLQVPIGTISSVPRFEISGNREVIIDGCKSILVYDENLVKLNTGKMITSFFGRSLTIRSLTPDSLVVEGFITSIEFAT